MQLLLIIAYAPQKPGQQVAWGGTAIVIPWSAIELNKGEDQSQAIARIRKTRGAPKELEGGAVSANMTMEGAHRKIVCAYAPSKPNNDDIGTIWVRGTEDEIDNRREVNTDTAAPLIFSPTHGFHRGWAKPETHGFQPQESSLKPETQHETHSCQNLKPETQHETHSCQRPETQNPLGRHYRRCSIKFIFSHTLVVTTWPCK